jgi:histidine triad (HIT) family protein
MPDPSTKPDCIFCQIITGEKPARIVYHDQELTAFWDHYPATPVHILIVPNKHIESMNKVDPADADMLGRMLLKARDIAEEMGVRQKGYRLLINTERGGGQSVFHIHLHLFAGDHLLAVHG